MPGDARQVVIVHGGAADALVVEREAARFDDIERNGKAGGQADEGTEILRNIGLEKGDAHGLLSPSTHHDAEGFDAARCRSLAGPGRSSINTRSAT